MRMAYLHGWLGNPVEADAWNRHLRGVEVVGLPLGVADHWPAEIHRLSRELDGCDAVMGYSLGARLALAVALEYPHAVPALVLISGSPGLAAAERHARRGRDAVWRTRLLDEPIDSFLREWYRQPVFADDPAECLTQLQAERQQIDRAQQARLLQMACVAEQPDYRPQLHRLEMPVLFLAGGRDAKYAALAREMCARVPRGTLEIITGGGHIIHRSHPNRCAAAIESFLAARGRGQRPTE